MQEIPRARVIVPGDDPFRLARNRMRLAWVIFLGGSFFPFLTGRTFWHHLGRALGEVPGTVGHLIDHPGDGALTRFTFVLMTLASALQVISFFVLPQLLGALQRSPVGLLVARVLVPAFLIAGGFYFLQRTGAEEKQIGLILLAVAMVHQVLGLWYIPVHPQRIGRAAPQE